MTARAKNYELRERLSRRGIEADNDQANTLRRAEMTLHRWGELECGDGNDYASWAIERDETSGKPYRCTYPHTGKSSRQLIPDREKGALGRVADLCKVMGLHFYHQTDPRGCALYVADVPLDAMNYSTTGVYCAA